MDGVRAARTLGWASIGIGLVEIFAPDWLGEQLGVGSRRTLFRVLGAREIASGLVILSQHENTPTLRLGVWSRVAGDAIDGGLLAAAGAVTDRPGGVAAAAVMVTPIAGADVACAAGLERLAVASDDDPWASHYMPGWADEDTFGSEGQAYVEHEFEAVSPPRG